MRLIERALRGPHHEAVRRRIFRQLIESLIYEGVVTPRQAGEPGRFAIDGTDQGGGKVSYLFDMQRRPGVDRVRLGPEPIQRHGTAAAEATSLTRFRAETHALLGAEPARVAAFARELEETLLKDAVARQVRAERGAGFTGLGYD